MLLHDPSIWLKDLLLNAGVSFRMASFLSTAGLILTVAFLAWLSNVIARLIIRTIVIRIVRKTTSVWDDIFLENKVFTRLSHFAPALVIWFMAGWALKGYTDWLVIVQRLTYAYMLVIGIVVINSFIESWYHIYMTLPISKHRPIKGYVQIVKIIVVIIFSLLIFSVLFKKEVTAILAGLGVMASVILLIFKDAILGLVASIQLSANNMVKTGDWITMPARDIDGEVADITLTTVKVKNFDKTIMTVPTYSLVNESFQNWKGMEESGVRLIRRPIFIDMKSIRFADNAMLGKIDNFPGIGDYIQKQETGSMIMIKDAGNKKSYFFSSGQLTNLGIFRMYAEGYLRNHPMIDRNQTVIVRHREPSGNGIPLQIYAFTSKTGLITYENIQSEIFEHLLAVMNEFDLKIYQQPTGDDLLALAKNKPVN